MAELDKKLTTAPPRLRRLADPLAQEEHGFDVDSLDRPPVVDSLRHDRLHPQNASGVDRIVESLSGRSKFRALRVMGEIRNEDVAPERGDILETRSTETDRKDVNPFTKQPFSDRPTRAARGAGYDRSSLTRRHRLPHRALTCAPTIPRGS